MILFLERGVSINGGPNSTPLINAVKNGLTEAILPLIENGANQYKQTPDGETALSAACKTQNVEAVKILVDNMIDIDLKPNDKLIFKIIFFSHPSAVHWACLSKNPEIVSIILKKGCDMYRVDNNDVFFNLFFFN